MKTDWKLPLQVWRSWTFSAMNEYVKTGPVVTKYESHARAFDLLTNYRTDEKSSCFNHSSTLVVGHSTSSCLKRQKRRTKVISRFLIELDLPRRVE